MDEGFKCEGFTAPADRLLSTIGSRFNSELARITIENASQDGTRWATPDDVLEALDVLLNCRPDWATKVTKSGDGGM